MRCVVPRGLDHTAVARVRDGELPLKMVVGADGTARGPGRRAGRELLEVVPKTAASAGDVTEVAGLDEVSIDSDGLTEA